MTLGWSSTIRINSTLAGREGHNRMRQSWSIQGANPIRHQYTDREGGDEDRSVGRSSFKMDPHYARCSDMSFHFVSIGIEDKILGRKVIQPDMCFKTLLVVLKFGWERSEIQEWKTVTATVQTANRSVRAHKLRRRLDEPWRSIS